MSLITKKDKSVKYAVVNLRVNKQLYDTFIKYQSVLRGNDYNTVDLSSLCSGFVEGKMQEVIDQVIGLIGSKELDVNKVKIIQRKSKSKKMKKDTSNPHSV